MRSESRVCRAYANHTFASVLAFHVHLLGAGLSRLVTHWSGPAFEPHMQREGCARPCRAVANSGLSSTPVFDCRCSLLPSIRARDRHKPSGARLAAKGANEGETLRWFRRALRANLSHLGHWLEILPTARRIDRNEAGRLHFD